MKARLQEMEDEANKLKEMQAKAEEDANAPAGGAEARCQSRRGGWPIGARGRRRLRHHPRGAPAAFAACGTVNRVTILTDKYENPKGFAYVEFLEADAVQNAIALTDTEITGASG